MQLCPFLAAAVLQQQQRTIHLLSILHPTSFPGYGSQRESITYLFLGAVVPLPKCSPPALPEAPGAAKNREQEENRLIIENVRYLKQFGLV